MRLKDLIQRNSWPSVEIILLNIYPSEEDNIDYYEDVFEELIMIQETSSKMILHLSWVPDVDEIDVFHVKICGIACHHDTLIWHSYHNLDGTEWNDWLGMEISQNTLRAFSELEIIACCIVEMTKNGNSEDKFSQIQESFIKTIEEYWKLIQKKKAKAAFMKDFERHRYKIIKIGEQVWMAMNLNTNHFRNGDLILEARTQEEWNRANQKCIPAWCHYNNDPMYSRTYGKLYNLYAIIDPRGLAPEGWRIPNTHDWVELINSLGGPDIAGKKLKSVSEWKDPQGLDSIGFNALPGGCRSDTEFMKKAYSGFWWSSAHISPKHGFYLYLMEGSNCIHLFFCSKDFGYSVRCIKNTT